MTPAWPVHEQLTDLVNGACPTRLDAVAAVFRSRAVAVRAARRLAPMRVPAAGDRAADRETVSISPYRGPVAEAHELRAYLERHLGRDLVGAYVHGSVGTGEVIPYSDFDALVIVRTEVLQDAERLGRAAYHLNHARRFMLRFDPLQHHGWFAMGEGQLEHYPEGFLPVAALRESRALVPDHDHELRITRRTQPAEAMRAQYARTVRVLGARLRAKEYPRDAYALKVLLSNVMLLPALYLQARDGRGVFKRESFAMARADFSPDVWAVMDDVSEMRARWVVPVDGLRRFLLTRTSPLRRAGKRLAPPLTPALRARLTPEFYDRLLRLIEAFDERLAAHGTSRAAGASLP